MGVLSYPLTLIDLPTNLENIGYETLIRTKKALAKMGIAW